MKPDIEVEYKFKVRDDKHLSQIVEHLDAMLDSDMTFFKRVRTYDSNVMFDNPLKQLHADDARLRVRTRGNEGEKVLTYKKPLPSKNGAKREIEFEIKFKDGDRQIEKLLDAIYFAPVSSYERYRTEWHLGNAEVTVDEYPFATFIEIEGQEGVIQGLAEELGFDLMDGLLKPADTLFQEWRKEQGLPFKPYMKFKDYDKR